MLFGPCQLIVIKACIFFYGRPIQLKINLVLCSAVPSSTINLTVDANRADQYKIVMGHLAMADGMSKPSLASSCRAFGTQPSRVRAPLIISWLDLCIFGLLLSNYAVYDG